MYSRVIIPLDGSPVANSALPHAEAVATAFRIPVHVIRVVEDVAAASSTLVAGIAGPSDYGAMEQLIGEEESDARAHIEGVIARLAQKEITATGEVILGSAATAIVEAMRTGDVVVMASHGRSGFRRFMMGSVAEDIIRHASVPVLVIRSHEDHTAK